MPVCHREEDYMGVRKYINKGVTYWQVDETLTMPDGTESRFRKRRIPTKELAQALVAKAKSAAFEGRFFEKLKPCLLTVAEAWAMYQPVTKRDNDAWQSDKGRAAHVLQHLGPKRAQTLTEADVDAYRNVRLSEVSRKGGAPAPASLDREVELLKRMLNYAVRCGKLPTNPIAKAKLLNQPNVRRVVLKEEQFLKLLAVASQDLKPILVIAYETGMRKQEVLNLRWSQVDLKEGCLALAPQDTKTDEGRVIYLTQRARQALQDMPRLLRCDYVFANPRTGTKWIEIRDKFAAACKAAGFSGVWFHDLRRSFVTNTRRIGVPESVVMRMSGHKTRAVFDRYNVVEAEDSREAVRRIEAGQKLRQESVKVGKNSLP